MTEPISVPVPAAVASVAGWTCPFCPLLCDGFGIAAAPGAGLALTGSDCHRARSALAQFGATASPATPMIAGQPAGLDAAVAAAARVLAASRQPLFGGLAIDVAGARALHALACATGAVCDAAHGAASTEGLRALQDRGGFSTTLAEIHAHADLMVCIAAEPTEKFPEFYRRCGVGAEGGLAANDIVVVGAGTDTRADLFDTVATLAALVAGLAVRDAPEALRALAARLKAARYAVIVYETGRLPPHGALVIEAINRIVATLNAKTRAAAFALGSDAGEATVNQVVTWLSGLPLRSRAAPGGLEHEPFRFDAARLLADGAVDALLWVSSFTADAPPPETGLPCVVLGHPGLAPACGDAAVFIPVSTPGIGSAGHLFRGDGSVLLPLQRIIDDGLPTVADVLARLHAALKKVAA